MAVDGHEDDRRHQRMRHLVQRQRAELAAVDAALHAAAEQAVGRDHDLVGVELCQLGEVAHLGEHDLVDGRRRRVADALPPGVQQLAQQVGAAAFELRRDLFALGDQARQRLPHHGLEEFLLARVVEVQRALGDAGALRHLFGARAGEALLDEQGQRRVQQFLRSRFLAALARVGLGGGAHLNDLRVSNRKRRRGTGQGKA